MPLTPKQDARVYITGASGAGVTSLGAGVAGALNIRHLDIDNFFWLPTNPPYTTKRPIADRLRSIIEARGGAGWVLSGSFEGWGDPLIVNVDLIVSVTTAEAVRIQRLISRERNRHGNRILPGGDMHETHKAFVEWAEGYEKADFVGRNRVRHEAWLTRQRSPVLPLDGERTPDFLAAKVIAKLTHFEKEGAHWRTV